MLDIDKLDFNFAGFKIGLRYGEILAQSANRKNKNRDYLITI